MNAGTGERYQNILTHLLADELVGSQQRWDVGVTMAEQKLNLAVYQHLLADGHAVGMKLHRFDRRTGIGAAQPLGEKRERQRMGRSELE